MRYFIVYGRLFRGSGIGTARRTGYANGADGGRSRGVMNFRFSNSRSPTKMVLPTPSSVTSTTISSGRFSTSALTTSLRADRAELTADLHALGVAGQAYRNGDRYGLALGDAVEIQVEDLLAYGGWNCASRSTACSFLPSKSNSTM